MKIRELLESGLLNNTVVEIKADEKSLIYNPDASLPQVEDVLNGEVLRIEPVRTCFGNKVVVVVGENTIQNLLRAEGHLEDPLDVLIEVLTTENGFDRLPEYMQYTPLDDENLSDYADYYWVRPKTEEAADRLLGALDNAGSDNGYGGTVGEWICVKVWDDDVSTFKLHNSIIAATDFFSGFGLKCEIN